MKALVIVWFGFAAIAFSAESYDPLKVPDRQIRSQTYEARDAERDRVLPLRVYLPDSNKPAAVVLFSHGLGGSRDNNPYLGNHWAKRGYVVVFVQHPGSDESVWKDAPALQRMGAMKRAASAENYAERVHDIPVVLDTLARWNSEEAHSLNGRLDLEHVGMSGHSFGAQTTQAVAGQSFFRGKVSYQEPRIDAAVMMSPSPPAVGDPDSAFGSIRIPCLLLTGTKDDSPIGNSSPEDRLKVFPSLKNAPAWQVVFNEATHMDFGERVKAAGENPERRYHRAILALTTAFWDAELRKDPKALGWLNGKEAGSVLLGADRWERNALTGKSE